MKRVNKVRQIKEIVLENGNIYPLSPKVHIELDKKNKAANKLHQIYYQQGSNYGSVGDRCDYITHDELFRLEEKGMIIIN